MKKYVAYYRASRETQRDGLGLDVQKAEVDKFIENEDGEVIKTITEIVSGGDLNREGFNKAIAYAKRHDATILVHRIDRLSRSGFATLALLEEHKVPFIETVAPHDSEFSKNIKFLVAKEEREKIQARIKDALGQIKENIATKGYHVSKAGNKITSLGAPETNLSDEGRAKSIKTRRVRAIKNKNNQRAYAMVKKMQDRHTLKQMAEALNDGGFVTSTGKNFYPIQISNLIKLYEEDEQA